MSVPTDASHSGDSADAESTTAMNNEQPKHSEGERVQRCRQTDLEKTLLAIMIKCIPGNAFRIVVAFDPILDDPDNPAERVLRISNGLRPSDSNYEVVVLRIRMTPDGHHLIDTLECTDGVTFDIPTKHQKIRPVIKGRMVHDSGLVYAELDNHAVGPYFCTSVQPTVMQSRTPSSF